MVAQPKSAISLALRLADPALSERLGALLSEVPGIRLVPEASAADVLLVTAPDPTDAETVLSQREIEVLALLSEGASNKEIARRLGISVHTAKFHVRSVMNKVDAGGRTEAVAQAARLHLIRL